MNAHIIQFLRGLRGSYWFLPSAMVLGALLLSVVTLTVDASWSEDLRGTTTWWLTVHPDGARSMLATIAGSMIGIAGVTFSMTLVSVSFAAANYGPRLIGNFMRDRGNQLVLGTFIATFVYALLILRAVRSASESHTGFSPQISLLVAMLLTLASVSVLVYFVHHVPETINVSRLTASIGQRLARAIEQVFPKGLGDGGDAVGSRLERFAPGEVERLTAPRSGYLKTLNDDRLLEIARQYELEIALQFRPGDFAVAGDELLWARPRERWNDEVEEALRGCFAFGSSRTYEQDVLFLADQLVEILGRALSPGINDPYTAIDCIRWMQAALCAAVTRAAPAAVRLDDEGAVRVISYPVTFERLLERLVDRSLPYVVRDRNTSLVFLEMLATVAARCASDARQTALIAAAERVATAAGECLPCALHHGEVDAHLSELREIAASPDARRRKLDDQDWLGGTG